MNNFFTFLNKINYLVGNDRKKLLWLIPLILISSVLDLIGIGLIVSFVSLLISGDLVGILRFLGIEGYQSNSINLIILLSCILFLLFLIKAITAIYVNKTILKICFNYGAKLRSYLIYLYQGMSYSDYASRNSSEYVYNVQTLAGQFSTSIVQSILRIISEGIVGLLILIFLALNSGIAFYIFLIILLLSVYFYDKSFKKKNNEYGVTVNSSSTSMIQSIQEAMFGYKENHIYGITGYFNSLVHIFANKLAAARVKSMVISTSSRYVIELVVITFIAMVAILSTLMGKETTFIISTITMFGVASLRLMPSAIQILISFGNIRYGKNSVDKLYYDVQKYSTEIDDFNSYKIDLKQNDVGIKKTSETFESIELQNIDFAYQNDAEPILENVNLKVRKGEMIGIIGSSGSGKTTLMDILLGFLSPISGRISFNDKLMNQNISEWSSKLAYIPQEVFIADSSFRSNIALGVVEDEIDEEKIELAIRQAQLKELVDKLDDGIKTSIGERGLRLSGGEKQRIALARAIYHERDILFMDESTSALDMETEEQILTEIKSLKGLKTFIIVAHNYETLKYCDEIYEVSEKKLISKGTFKELKK